MQKQKQKKNTTKNKKNNKGDGSYSERVREKFFCCQEKLKIRYITCSSVIQKLDLVSFGDH